MEEGGSERNDDKKKHGEEKTEGETTDSESTTMDGGKDVNNEKVGENVDLDEFYDIYDNDEKKILQKVLLFG